MSRTKHKGASAPSKKELRNFGLLLGGFLLAVALLPLLKGEEVRYYAIVAGMAVGALGLASPYALRVPYRLWMKFAHVMMIVNTKIILSAVFFLLVCPTGLVLRLLGKDILALKQKKDTYWVPCHDEGADENFERQF